MAKVTMYKGVDFKDGMLTYFAVCGDRCATTYTAQSKWTTPDGFGDFNDWHSHPLNTDDIENIGNAELVWETAQ
ncbi:MAG: hypothetical protein ACRC8W_21380 [Plesiomonas shigelloides]